MTFGGATFFSKEDVEIPISKETFNIESSAYGKNDERLKERKVEINMTLVGQWDATTVAAIWTPFASMVAGTSIFSPGAAAGPGGGSLTDYPVVITSLVNGTTVTGKAAAITKLPDIICSTNKTLIGPMTLTVIGANNTSWDTASSLIATAIGSGPPSDPGTFDATKILTKSFTAGWSFEAGFTSFQTQEGITISFGLQTTPQETDTDGMVDMYFKQLDVQAKCIPLGMTEADLITAMAIQGTGNLRGSSLASGTNLTITGAGSHPIIVINSPGIKSARMRWGQSNPRMGEIEFVATRTTPSQSLFTITV